MICPISHLPIHQVTQPVRFRRGPKNAVYEAEYVVGWLRFGRMVEPMTNLEVEEGMAFDLLEPCRIEHISEADLRRTEDFLKNAGYLDGKGGGVKVKKKL